MQIHNTNTGGFCCSDTNAFINLCFQLFDTRRETQFLKVFHNHSMLTPPPMFGTSCGAQDLNSSLPVEIRKTQHFDSMAESPSSRLHGPMSTFNWTFIKILKFSGPSPPGMTSSTHQPHFLSWVYYDNGDCHILCERA